MSGNSHSRIGIAAMAFAAFLFFVGIPFGVTAPSNVGNIVLSPIFWPEVLAALLALAGLGLVLAGRRLGPDDDGEAITAVPGGVARLAAMAALMLLYFLAIPVLGLVWASMIAFAAAALLVRTRHPVAAFIAAAVAPLLLYAFFAHVAGVAVPQGEFLRLP